jgi:predicted RNase H-like HicB family nuclease
METTLTPDSADQYLIVIEGGGASFSAYAPDLPGCVAAASNVQECEQLMREAIVFHLEGMREDGDPIPPPTIAAAAFVPAA